MTLDDIDPSGLIAEAYRIEGITGPECRSIFLDWLLRVPQGVDERVAIGLLLEARPEAHPMTAVLREGLARPERTGRRGGRGARHGY